MYGSLTDFLEEQYLSEINHPSSELQPIDLDTDVPFLKKQSSIRKQHHLKQSRKNKMRGQSLAYEAANKKQLLRLFHQNYPIESQKMANKNVNLTLKTNKESLMSGFEKQDDYLTGRKSILSKSKIGISMFEKKSTGLGNEQNTNEDLNSQTKLKRQHNLLRAIARTKARHLEEAPITDYQQSFNRMTDKIQKIKIKPSTIEIDKDRKIHKYGREMISAQELKKQIEQILPLSSRSLHIGLNSNKNNPKAGIAQKKLSSYTRIQFENCLSWSKKHNKNGQFYEQKLGKSRNSFDNKKKRSQSTYQNHQSKKYFQEDTEKQQLQSKRKAIMAQVYHHRSFSTDRQ